MRGAHAALLLFVGLGTCAHVGAACNHRTTETAPPLPQVAFEAWVKPPFMSVSRCNWTAPRNGREPAVECSLLLERDMEMHGLWWVAYARDGREIGRGGAAFTSWKRGEERRVAFALHRPAQEIVARIGIEPF